MDQHADVFIIYSTVYVYCMDMQSFACESLLRNYRLSVSTGFYGQTEKTDSFSFFFIYLFFVVVDINPHLNRSVGVTV